MNLNWSNRVIKYVLFIFNLLFVFSILLSLIFIMEFSAGIAGYVLRDNTASYLEKKLEDTMKKYDFNENTTSAVTIMWDTIQSD
ncbi:Tetraspannin domain containing protein, partial [Asbolus verrucosus]